MIRSPGPWRDALQRKLRKLQRDPRSFFADSWLASLWPRLTAPSSPARLEAPKPAKPPKPAAPAGPQKLAAALAGSPFAPFEAVGRLGPTGAVLADRLPAERGWSSLLLVRVGGNAAVAGLLAAMAARQGFAPVAPTNLGILEVDAGAPRAFPTAPALMATLTTAARDRLSRFQNLIVLDDLGVLATALRATHPDLRVVQVVAAGAPPEGCTPLDTDILVTAEPPPHGPWRRVLRAEPTPAGLAAALGRALQEAGPKPLELLLPAWGEAPFDPALLDRCIERVDGVLMLRPRATGEARPARPRNFADWLDADLTPRLAGVLLAERTMWRYRSLADAATGPEDWARLVGIMLRDGARLEVRPAERCAAAGAGRAAATVLVPGAEVAAP